MFLPVLSLTLISYTSLHSKHSFTDTVCGSEALPHPSPSNPLDSNTHSPQSFISSSSAVYGVMLKTQNSGMFQLEKKKKSVLFFVFLCCCCCCFSLKIRFVAFTEELSKQLCP